MQWSWEVFHYALAGWVMLYVFLDGKPGIGRQYLFGAEIHVLTLVLCDIARDRVGDLYPVVWYALIDAAAVCSYALIMFRKKALWAAGCVILHGAFMMPLHLIFYLGGEQNQKEFLWALGIVTALVAVVINIGTFAGRHAIGARVDNYLIPRLRGWSWSGAVSSRIKSVHNKVA